MRYTALMMKLYRGVIALICLSCATQPPPTAHESDPQDAKTVRPESTDAGPRGDEPESDVDRFGPGDSHLASRDGSDLDIPEREPSNTVLIFTETQGYRHISIEHAVQVLTALLEADGLQVVHAEDSAIFNQPIATSVSALVFLSTTGDVLSNNQQATIRQFVESGGGWLGIHAAADAEYNWPWYESLVGAWFDSHPAIQEATIEVNTSHPVTAMLPPSWTRRDEWYDFQTPPPDDSLILMYVNENSYEGGKMGLNHPIAWAQQIGEGRSLYTACGHTAESYNEPLFQAHLMAAIRWVAQLEI